MLPRVDAPAPKSRAWLIVTLLLPLLPFAHGLLTGRTLFFRDLGLQYFPLRRFLAAGLRVGEWRAWNPYMYEGLHEALAPLGYPLDLLPVLWPDERFLSLLLIAHLPWAAAGAFRLASWLGWAPPAATLTGCTYALGGFALSTLNLYDAALVLAWAPWVLLGLGRVVQGGGPRALAAAGFCLACALATRQVEFVLQIFPLALALLPARPSRRALGGLALVGLLAVALSAPAWLSVTAALPGSQRGQGLPPAEMLLESIHPLTFVQVLVSQLYGDLQQTLAHFWGERLFSRGFPYFLSLYLGPGVVALALVGLTRGRLPRWRVLALLLLAAWIGLGSWGGWESLLELVPGALRRSRYPAKAFFTLHLLASLLAGAGLDALLRQGWAPLRRPLLALGATLLLPVAVLAALPGSQVAEMCAAWLPAALGPAARLETLGRVAGDAAFGAALALALAGIVYLAEHRRIGSAAAAGLLLALVTADLVRAGAGLNPMLPLTALRPSGEVLAEVAHMKAAGGRLFVCDPLLSRSYPPAAVAHEAHLQTWATGVMVETLMPYTNLPLGLPIGLPGDRTGLVPAGSSLPTSEGDCGRLAELLPLLRRAGVAHVVMADLVAIPGLRPRVRVVTQRTLPLGLVFYELEAPLPLAYLASEAEAAADQAAAARRAAEAGFEERGAAVVEADSRPPASTGSLALERDAPGHLTWKVEAGGPGLLVVRQSHAPGWQARVGQRPAALLRANGRHLAVAVPAGVSRVELDYVPPGASLMAALPTLGLVVLAGLYWAGRKRRGPTGEP